MATSINPIQSTFERAVLEFKKDLNDDEIYDKISQATTIDQVYAETDKLQAEQAENGHLRHLSKIEPYLTRLDDYAQAIGIFVQAKPDILALIWGPIVLLLQWANVLKASFDAIVDAAAEIGIALPEFKQAALLFRENDRIGDVLLFFFKDIIGFYSIALRFFRLPRWRYVFEVLWPQYRDKIKVVKKNIERHTLLMRRDVQSEHIQQQYEARVRALEHFDVTERAHRRQEYQSITINMRPELYDDKLYWVQSRVCQGTGKWLLKSPAFTEWLDGSERSKRCLWLQGIPGSGKTFLASTVIQSARDRGKALFVFLTYTLADKTTALSVLHSLIFQLASQDEMLQSVVCGSSRETLKNSLDAAQKLLCDLLLTCAGPVYIMVDGLDEIGELERCLLVKRLKILLEASEELRVCFSSRPEADLKMCLAEQPKSTLRVDAENAGSIQVFVSRWTEDWVRECHASEEFAAEIRRLLASLAWKSKGMFLYANVVLRSVEFMDSISEIENELRVLPEDLNAAYERIFQRINGLQSTLKEKTRKLLGWIACTPTPLTPQEIQHALTIRSGDREGKSPLLADLRLDKVCGPIVEVVDDYIQFVHFTVKEYISSPRIVECIDIRASILSLATCCITYFCQQHHDPELLLEEISDNALKRKYVFHEYAIINWIKLVERASQLTPDTTAASDLTRALGILLEDRGNPCYIGDFESSQPAFKPLKGASPELHAMLDKVYQFRREYSASQHKRQAGSSWIDLDPLTISKTSVQIHEAVDSLLDCRDRSVNSCDLCDHCRLRSIYGARPFKCSFVDCRYRRLGFETRAARQSHEKYHDRPWKCSVPTCEFATGGFLSRSMRDDHLDRYHQKRETDHIPRATQPGLDPDEIQPLLFDLIQTDNVEAVRALLPFWNTWRHIDAEAELLRLAASVGSPTLVDMLLSANFQFYRYIHINESLLEISKIAADHSNIETLAYALKRSATSDKTSTICSKIFSNILDSDSEEAYDLWEGYVDDELKLRHTTPGYHASQFASYRILQKTAGHPDRTQTVLNLWTKKSILEAMGQTYCGDTLVAVAQTNCSIEMTKRLLKIGIGVDHRRSSKYLSALHHAARKTSAEAAELAKFLLLCGADPQLTAERSKTRISDEKGAKNISKHLGVTWDELVVQTKKQREEVLSRRGLKPDSEEALNEFARLVTSHQDAYTGS
ncbi:hypothetical protein MFIFM68171_09658 [Madurella fahalii]|uniref:NACHT domain-containing protein n=1 Tax=Madurella fahalii TaxID=1157608 RepID=A0ABQ0GNY5_9PEZI